MVGHCSEWWEKNLTNGWGWANNCNFGGAVGELNKKFWHFWFNGVAVTDINWDENDLESLWTERRFDRDKEDGGGNLINDDCDKHDGDNCDDGCGDNISRKVSIIILENLMFSFSIRWRWSS